MKAVILYFHVDNDGWVQVDFFFFVLSILAIFVVRI